MISHHSFKKTQHNFYEKQRFKNHYVLAALIIFELVSLYFCYEKLMTPGYINIWSINTLPIFLFTLFVPTLLLAIYYFTRFEMIINEEGLFYRWRPFKKRYKMIHWSGVREISLVDLGNAGLKWAFSGNYDEVNYIGGKVGILFLMKSGKKRIFNTGKAEEINRVFIRLAGSKYKPSTIGQNIDYSD